MNRCNNSLLSKAFQQKTVMGQNSLYLVQELSQQVRLEPGMRVLDLSCGCGLTSLFLASHYDVQVIAMNSWVSATDNARRFEAMEFDHRIMPLHLEVMDLPRLKPFAENYFDAVISVDAYFYFGASPRFFDDYLAPFMKPGSAVALAIPGLKRSFLGNVPEVLQPFWQENRLFYTRDWWYRLWQQSAHLKTDSCAEMDCFHQVWDEWLLCESPFAVREREMMAAEADSYFNFIKMTGHVEK